ncbi:TonB-dependent receptor [Aliiroseovarius sp.]|uniref:TonB-dependent receptor plug domain-containing protein n=1 Tax=Aliiroseovarius sp. TaxID=1872442 RepID=UPI002612E526|nr:TonB-dependent receptor [Aliiroseovarius sp.]
MTRRVLLASAATTAIAVLTTTPALSQEIFDLGTITVSANAEATELARSGTTVEVIGGDELSTQSTGQIANYFTRLPGVVTVNNGGLGTNTTFRIRGLGGAYVPVLIDGIDMSDPASTGNGFSWGGLTGAGIGRVEILKGAQSARYGQGAIGGVVNIDTWRPEVDGASGQASVEYGSYNTRAASASAGFRDARTELAFTASRILTDGFSTLAANTEDDAYRATRLSFSATHQATDNLLIGAAILTEDSFVEYDETFDGDPTNDNTATTARAGRLSAEFSTGAVDHDVSFSKLDTERRDTGWYSFFKGEREKVEYRGNVALGMTDLSFGIDHLAESATTVDGLATTTTTTANTTGLFAEAAFAPTDALDVVVSLRHDDNSRFGGMFSKRVAAAWRPAEDWIIRAQAGTGFRAPSLTQLDTFYGPGDFDPEESLNLELGAERRLGGEDFVKATLFYNEIDNQIYFDGASTSCTSTFGCFETQSFTAKGIELSGQVALSDTVDLTGAYTWTDAKAADGTELGRHAEHVLAVGLDVQATDDLSLGVTAQRFGGVNPSPFDAGFPLVDDYTLVGLNASYDLGNDMAITLRVENLLDEQYQTSGGYNTAGRSAYLGLSASF